MALPISISTTQLLLRPLLPADADAISDYSQDDEYAFFMLPGQFDRAALARRLAASRPWNEHVAFAIVADGQVIGEVALSIDHANGIADLGYGVARTHWGRGIATEAAQATIDYGFTAFADLAKVWAHVDPCNAGSVRVLEKLGMQREAWLRSHAVRRGERVDRFYYGLLRDEWAQRRSA